MIVNDLDTDIIGFGETLLVPIHGDKIGEDISVMSNKPAPFKVPERFIVYVVKKGDALFNIARRHGITVGQIKSWNRQHRSPLYRAKTHTQADLDSLYVARRPYFQ